MNYLNEPGAQDDCTVNHLVVGSNPTSGATTSAIPWADSFQRVKRMSKRRTRPNNPFLDRTLIQRGLDPNYLKAAALALDIPYTTLRGYADFTKDTNIHMRAFSRDSQKLGLTPGQFVDGLLQGAEELELQTAV